MTKEESGSSHGIIHATVPAWVKNVIFVETFCCPKQPLDLLKLEFYEWKITKTNQQNIIMLKRSKNMNLRIIV